MFFKVKKVLHFVEDLNPELKFFFLKVLIIIIKARSSRDSDSLNFFCNETIQYTYYYTNMCLQILMLQNGVLRGRRSMDRYRDWRLDIDDMTYEVWFTHSHCLPDLFRVFLFC